MQGLLSNRICAAGCPGQGPSGKISDRIRLRIDRPASRYLTILANRRIVLIVRKGLETPPSSDTEGGYAPTRRLSRVDLHPGATRNVQGESLKARGDCPSAVVSTPGAARGPA